MSCASCVNHVQRALKKVPGVNDASVNLATGVMALLYGNGDYKRTVQIATLSGWDSDNSTASLGGLFGLSRDLHLETSEAAQPDALRRPIAHDDDFEAIASSGYSVSLFTDWRTSRFEQVWLKRRVTPGEPLETPLADHARAVSFLLAAFLLHGKRSCVDGRDGATPIDTAR